MIGEGVADLPPNAPALLADRVDFIMVSQLEAKLADLTGQAAPAAAAKPRQKK